MEKLLFLGFVIIFFGCKTPYRTYTIFNDTSHYLEIEGFSSRHYLDGTINVLKANEINIDPNSKVEFDREYGEGSDERTFFSVPVVDSVRINFNSEKVLVHTCKDLTDNTCPDILKGAFVVTITEEDYENAIPIE